MKNTRGLPVPFLILILAGAVSLGSVVANRGAQAGTARNDSVQMQTIEQERMAELYFRVLSWLSGLKTRATDPATATPHTSTSPKPVKSPPRGMRRSRIEFCTFSSARNPPNSKPTAYSLN